MRKMLGKIALLYAAMLMVTALLAGCTEKPEPTQQPNPTQEAAVQLDGKGESSEANKEGKSEKSDGPAVGGTKGNGPAAGSTKGEGPSVGGTKSDAPVQDGTKGEGPAKQTATPAPTAAPTLKPTATPCKHKWIVTESVAAECITAGYEKYKCELCGKTDQKTLESIGEHDTYLFSESSGTCQSPAQKNYACHVCGGIVLTETGGYGDHKWWVSYSEPTCDEDGGTYAQCEICGEEKLNVLPATGHNYVGGECTNCGDVAMG